MLDQDSKVLHLIPAEDAFLTLDREAHDPYSFQFVLAVPQMFFERLASDNDIVQVRVSIRLELRANYLINQALENRMFNQVAYT